MDSVQQLVNDASIAGMRAAMARGDVTSEQLTGAYLARIAAHDEVLGSVIALNPEALSVARARDAETSTGPLHGIPILIKDNVEVAGMPTTAGSLALANNMTGRDAPIVKSLREAGAVIVGKTNLSEWANFRSRRSVSGWSAVGGQARNPYDVTRSPCGSSSGSGVAVAARFSAGAIGTETNGSVVCPAHVNGLVGLKPTVGLLASDNIVPISASQDTAGPMTVDAMSAAVMMQAMTGDAVFVTALENASMKGKRVGVLRSAMGYHDGVDKVFEAKLEALRDEGVIVIDNLALDAGYPGFRTDTFVILLHEFKDGLNSYFASLPGDAGSLTLAELIRFNEGSAEELKWFGQDLLTRAEGTGGTSDLRYQEALERAQKVSREAIDAVLTEHGLDALIAPTGAPAWTIDPVSGDHFLGSFSTYPAVSGYPQVTVPMGTVHGLPVGISFAGGRNSDASLLALAHAYQEVFGVAPPPDESGWQQP